MSNNPIPMNSFEFEIDGQDGAKQIGSNGRVALTLYPDHKNSRMRKRNAIKKACSPKAYKVQWLYGELDGVRCYVRTEDDFVSIVMTKQDLYP
jgi:hypothetical protein